MEIGGLIAGQHLPFVCTRGHMSLDDGAITGEDTPAIIDVLANDSTAAGTGSLEPSSVKGRYTACMGLGEASIHSTGAITYTPETKLPWCRSAHPVIMATVGASQSAAVTVTVRSVNDAPRLNKHPRTAAVAYAPYRYDIIAQDSDAGDTLAISAPSKPTWLTLAATGGTSAS